MDNKLREAAQKFGLPIPLKNYGSRPDKTKKGSGYWGELKLPQGGVATEYSVSVGDFVDKNGKPIEFPTLVPTLTQEELDLMVNKIIPNNEKVPKPILQKALAFARQRVADGKSPFK